MEICCWISCGAVWSVASAVWAASAARSSSTVSKVRTHSRFSFKIPWEVDSDRHFGRVRLLPPTLEATMQTVADRPEAPTAIRTDLGAIFVSLELSRSTWLITSLSPGGGEKMSKQVVLWWRCGRTTGALCATSRESAGEDGEGLPVRRHSGGWPRRILDRSRAAQ